MSSNEKWPFFPKRFSRIYNFLHVEIMDTIMFRLSRCIDWYAWWSQKVSLRFDLGPMSSFDLGRSCHTSIDAYWSDKHSDTYFAYLTLFDSYWQNSCCPQVTLDDLMREHWQDIESWSSRTYSVITFLIKLDWTEGCNENENHFNILRLTYNWEVKNSMPWGHIYPKSALKIFLPSPRW